MEAKAISKFTRISPRKVGQVLSLIRKKRVSDAQKILAFTKKAAVSYVEKVLNSALSNAGRNAKPENFFIKEAYTGDGPALKRFRAGSMGRGVGYKRRTSHITIVVTDEKGKI